MYDAFWYVIANEGVDTSKYYPFRAKVSSQLVCTANSVNVFKRFQQQSCYFSKNYVGASMSGTVRISSGCENSLLSAVAFVGPVSVAVDASNNAFRVSCLL